MYFTPIQNSEIECADAFNIIFILINFLYLIFLLAVDNEVILILLHYNFKVSWNQNKARNSKTQYNYIRILQNKRNPNK